jgi:hypothetical protein
MIAGYVTSAEPHGRSREVDRLRRAIALEAPPQRGRIVAAMPAPSSR